MFDELYDLINQNKGYFDSNYTNDVINVYQNKVASCIEKNVGFTFTNDSDNDPSLISLKWTRTELEIAMSKADWLLFQRLIGVLEILWPSIREFRDGVVNAHLGDFSPIDFVGLSFASANPLAILIPDSYFMMFKGYRKGLENIDRILNGLPEDKIPIQQAFWRGAFTGMLNSTNSGQITNQRIELAEISLKSSIIDAKITGAAGKNPELYSSLINSGLTGPFSPFEHCLAYQLQIDVDGYGPAWSGLFNKLYTSRPVIKIRSRYGFRQWYYFKLIDGYNIFYVEEDLSNIERKVADLLALPNENLKIIASRAREVIKSLDYKAVVCQKQREVSDWIYTGFH